MSLESRAGRQMTKVEFGVSQPVGGLASRGSPKVGERGPRGVPARGGLHGSTTWMGTSRIEASPSLRQPSWQLMAQMLLAARVYE